jgi:hypothetical protein
METATLGRSGLLVWRIALGTWQLGGDSRVVDERAGVATICRAHLTSTPEPHEGFGREPGPYAHCPVGGVLRHESRRRRGRGLRAYSAPMTL